MARGPELPPSAIELHHPIVDLAPTIAEWLGVELERVDGAPIAPLARPM